MKWDETCVTIWNDVNLYFSSPHIPCNPPSLTALPAPTPHTHNSLSPLPLTLTPSTTLYSSPHPLPAAVSRSMPCVFFEVTQSIIFLIRGSSLRNSKFKVSRWCWCCSPSGRNNILFTPCSSLYAACLLAFRFIASCPAVSIRQNRQCQLVTKTARGLHKMNATLSVSERHLMT